MLGMAAAFFSLFFSSILRFAQAHVVSLRSLSSLPDGFSIR
jgi:hypothetical protein